MDGRSGRGENEGWGMRNVQCSLFFVILQIDDEDALVKPVSFTRILKLNSPEWKYLLIGCFGAALFGAYPFLFGIAFGGIYEVSFWMISCVQFTQLIKHFSIKPKAGFPLPTFFYLMSSRQNPFQKAIKEADLEMKVASENSAKRISL